MPITSLLVESMPGRVTLVRDQLASLPGVEIHGLQDEMVVIVVDTLTHEEDRRLVQAIGALEGVVHAIPVFTNREDLDEADMISGMPAASGQTTGMEV